MQNPINLIRLASIPLTVVIFMVWFAFPVRAGPLKMRGLNNEDGPVALVDLVADQIIQL